ncbi:MAG: hypothetical protein AB8B80_11400 [Marinicellaceae bacterium]
MIKILITLIIVVSTQANSNNLSLAKNIKAVWNLTSQSCNGIGGNAMNRHPDEKNIITSKSISIPNSGFKYKIPQLPDVKNTYLKLFLDDKSRGVTDHYFLISDQDLEPPFAAIVVTELPSNMQTREQAFKAVHTLQKNSASKSGIEIELKAIDSHYNGSLELIINNRVGSYCFPTSDYKFLPKGYNAKTIGISRFSFINKKLVEFALIINISKEMTDEEGIKYAQNLMNSFWTGIKPV